MGGIHHEHVIIGELHGLLLNHGAELLHAAGAFRQQHHGGGSPFPLKGLGFNVDPGPVQGLFKHVLDLVVAGFIGGRIYDFALPFPIQQGVIQVGIHPGKLDFAVGLL